VLVSVHGISRNASEQAAVFAPLCERRNVVMVAPVFTVEHHEDYQRLGRRGRGTRVDHLLHQFLQEVGIMTGADVSRIHLFGFSGGAQFAHRYLMVHPHRVVGAVVVASGWYTFPDTTQRYPYGIRPHRALEGVNFNPEEFLRVPVEVLVGAKDTDTQNLRRTERTNAQQGVDRRDRARNWVRAMRDAAERHGLPPVVTLGEVPGIGHSFAEFCERGALVERAGEALFGPEPELVAAGRPVTNGARAKTKGSRPKTNGARAKTNGRKSKTKGRKNISPDESGS
jgi:pimeloyl-ACP methyl ester carboxylesterase